MMPKLLYIRVAAYAIVGAIIFLFVAACAQAARDIQIGMSQQEVVRRLGEPDRRAVLDGKVLRDIEEIESPDLSKYRLVYIYEDSGLHVWFKDGKVTGATRRGISIF